MSDRDCILLIEVPPDYSTVAMTFLQGTLYSTVLEQVLQARNLSSSALPYRLLESSSGRPIPLNTAVTSDIRVTLRSAPPTAPPALPPRPGADSYLI